MSLELLDNSDCPSGNARRDERYWRIFDALQNNEPAVATTEELVAVGDSCYEQGYYLEAFKAFSIARDVQRLRQVGDSMLEVGWCSYALMAYEQAGARDRLESISASFEHPFRRGWRRDLQAILDRLRGTGTEGDESD